MPRSITRTIPKITFGVLAALVVAACQKPSTSAREISAENYVSAGDVKTNRIIGDEENKFQVLGSGALSGLVEKNQVKLAGTKEADRILSALATTQIAEDASGNRSESLTDAPDSLVIGFPAGLLGENQVFGGVITSVSDTENESLGQLKLTDLDPLHVKTVVGKTSSGKFVFALTGCASKCTEASPRRPLIMMPVVGVDDTKQLVMVDLAALGNELNLVELLDPNGDFTQLKTKSSKTVAFDYSLSTLVFDVEASMVPVKASAPQKETVFTTRWYLRLASAFNPAFVPRPATPGVGFFMTARTASPMVQRFSLSTASDAAEAGPIKYYVKNVPSEYQKAFASAFDEWNATFEKILGKKMLSYEFVDANDPRAKLLVPGDVRYNIVEWDLVNKAPYGGLGPSIANQFTGETLTANVLIQGPTVIKIYTKWYELGQKANQLLADGRVMEADSLLRRAGHEIQASLSNLKSHRFTVSLGNSLEMKVRSQMPELEDPLDAPVQREDFDPIPAGVTFEKYMFGYFHDMLTHELGHNLGLRHNFRGNLSATATPTEGGVSHSIMEYLGRGYRYLDHVGTYDVMALKYGYLGVSPERKDMFCTDEDVPTPDNLKASAECSRDDATSDPYGFFESRLQRAVNLLTARGSSEAPTWQVEEMDRELKIAVVGMGLYAATAVNSASAWTNFFNIPGRPKAAGEVKGFVIDRFKAQLCDPSFAQVVAAKATDAAKKATEANITALRAKVVAYLEPYKAISASDLQCGPVLDSVWAE